MFVGLACQRHPDAEHHAEGQPAPRDDEDSPRLSHVSITVVFCARHGVLAFVHTALVPPCLGLPVAAGSGSGDGNRGVEVDVLDGVEELDAFRERALERLASDDEPDPSGALVDDRGAHDLGEVVGAL